MWDFDSKGRKKERKPWPEFEFVWSASKDQSVVRIRIKFKVCSLFTWNQKKNSNQRHQKWHLIKKKIFKCYSTRIWKIKRSKAWDRKNMLESQIRAEIFYFKLLLDLKNLTTKVFKVGCWKLDFVVIGPRKTLKVPFWSQVMS